MAGVVRRAAAATLVGAAALALLLAGCGARKAATVAPGDLHVIDLRIPAPAGPSAALYFTVVSHAAAPDRLEAVHTTIAGMTMIHRTVVEGDRVSMEPVPGGLVVPAGGRLVLQPGGAHVMLMQLKRKLVKGDRVPVSLRFQHAGEIQAEARVISYADLEAPGSSGGGGG